MSPVVVGGRPTDRGRAARIARIALLALLLGGLLGVGVGALPASAHAELLETTPEDGAVLETAPMNAELRFSEHVQLVDGAIRLFPGDDDPETLRAHVVDTTVVVELPAALRDGAYALSYRVVSADGHPVGGAITFQIGEGAYPAPSVTTAATDPAASETIVAVLTALQYLGLLLLAGLLFFDRIVLRATVPADVGTRRILRIAAGVAVSASLVLIPAAAVRVTGREFIGVRPDGSLDVLAPDTWVDGLTWQPVAAAIVVSVAALAALLVSARASSRASRTMATVLAAVAVSAPLLVGHTQTVQPGWLMLAADLGHLLAGAFWCGGLIGLLRFLAAAARRAGAETPTSPEAAARVVARFSRFALASVVLLALSGTVMAVLVVGSWAALLDTGYGLTLLLKLGIVAAVIPLAAWNRTRLLPRILRHPTAKLGWAHLRRILSYEAALLIAVVAVTAFLSNSSPIDQPTSPPLTASAPLQSESQGLTVDGVLSPAATGRNTLTFRLEYGGEPLTIEEVRVTARLPEQELGPFTATPRLVAATGEYEATLNLPVAGEWRIQITARVNTFTQPITIVPVTIR